MKKFITLLLIAVMFTMTAEAQKIVGFDNDTLAGDTISFTYEKPSFTTYTSDGVAGFDFTVGTDTATVLFQGSNGDTWHTIVTTNHNPDPDDAESNYHVKQDTISFINFRLQVESAASDADSASIENVQFFKYD